MELPMYIKTDECFLLGSLSANWSRSDSGHAAFGVATDRA